MEKKSAINMTMAMEKSGRENLVSNYNFDCATNRIDENRTCVPLEVAVDTWFIVTAEPQPVHCVHYVTIDFN